MAVIGMSGRELSRLRTLIDLVDDRLTLEAAAELMSLGRRQVFRLRRAFKANGPSALTSRKRGRPSNRRHGETLRCTVLALVRAMPISVRRLRLRSSLNVMVCELTSRRFDNGCWRTAYGLTAVIASPPRTSRVGDAIAPPGGNDP